jgi:hypothetical protein
MREPVDPVAVHLPLLVEAICVALFIAGAAVIAALASGA